MTSVNAIFSMRRFAASRTNMMTSPVAGFDSYFRSGFRTERTSSPIRSSADRISSSAYAFCSPLTSLPDGCLTLYRKSIRSSRSRSAKACFAESDSTFCDAAFLLGA